MLLRIVHLRFFNCDYLVAVVAILHLAKYPVTTSVNFSLISAALLGKVASRRRTARKTQHRAPKSKARLVLQHMSCRFFGSRSSIERLVLVTAPIFAVKRSLESVLNH